MKRRRPRQANMSLFPFLSVLCCVLAALILLLMGAAACASQAQSDKSSGGPTGEKSIVVLPSGSAIDLEPRFVECVNSGSRLGILLDPDRSEAEQSFVSKDDVLSSTEYSAFLKAVKGNAKATVIFLIRRGSVPGFRPAIERARSESVRHGYLPVRGTALLDFSKLRPAKR